MSDLISKYSIVARPVPRERQEVRDSGCVQPDPDCGQSAGPVSAGPVSANIDPGRLSPLSLAATAGHTTTHYRHSNTEGSLAWTEDLNDLVQALSCYLYLSVQSLTLT